MQHTNNLMSDFDRICLGFTLNHSRGVARVGQGMQGLCDSYGWVEDRIGGHEGRSTLKETPTLLDIIQWRFLADKWHFDCNMLSVSGL